MHLDGLLPNFLLKTELLRYLDPNDTISVSTSCITFYSQTKKTCQKRALEKLLQALFDHHPLQAQCILTSYPNFLFEKLSLYKITEIRGYLTSDESVFTMMQKLLRFEMVVKIMCPFFLEKLNNAKTLEDKSQLEKHWIIPSLVTQFRNEEEQHKLQEIYITNYLLDIIYTLIADQTIKIYWKVDPAETVEIDKASQTTLQAVDTLKRKLAEPKAIHDSIDLVQLLIAAYRALDRYENNFLNLDQRDAYVIYVINFLKNLVEPELRNILNFSDEAARCGNEISVLKNYVTEKKQKFLDLDIEYGQTQRSAHTL